MTKRRSQFGCVYLQMVQEVTGSLILNSNHSATTVVAKSLRPNREIYNFLKVLRPNREIS